MENTELYANLRGLIRAKYRTQHEFAAAIKVHPSTLSAKLNGRTQWSYKEVVAACQVLGVPLAEASSYFF